VLSWVIALVMVGAVSNVTDMMVRGPKPQSQKLIGHGLRSYGYSEPSSE
jgi:hypothetical protein